MGGEEHVQGTRTAVGSDLSIAIPDPGQSATYIYIRGNKEKRLLTDSGHQSPRQQSCQTPTHPPTHPHTHTHTNKQT